MSDYNYTRFSFDLDAVGMDRWLIEGPPAGQDAPDFSLRAVDGTTIRLSDFAGRPVVLEFGSYTCPIFCGHIAPMEAMAQRHPEAAFFVVYTREAHPGEITHEHRSLEDKEEAARRLLADEPMGRLVLIDDLEGTVHQAYGPAWDAAYVIDAKGKVVLRQAWTDPPDVDAVLTSIAVGTAVTPRETTDMAPPTGKPMGEGLLRGGTRALLDFYTTAPPPVQERLRQSPSEAVRSALQEFAKG